MDTILSECSGSSTDLDISKVLVEEHKIKHKTMFKWINTMYVSSKIYFTWTKACTCTATVGFLSGGKEKGRKQI